MFGKRVEPAESAGHEYMPVMEPDKLRDGDIAVYDDGGGLVVALVIGRTDGGTPVLQRGEYGVRRGRDAFDLFMPRAKWRFIGAFREVD